MEQPSSLKMQQLDQAIESLQQQLEKDNSNTELYNLLGFYLYQQGKINDALQYLERAVEIQDDDAVAHANLAKLYRENGQQQKAFASYRKVTQLKPADPESHYKLANAYYFACYLSEAIACYNKVIALKPNHANALNNLGNAYSEQGRISKAVEVFEKLVTLTPAHPLAASNLLFLQNYRDDLHPAELKKRHQEWGRSLMLSKAALLRPHPNCTNPNRRLRIGYLSSDLKQHSISYFLAPLLEAHDRKDFEVFCYSNIATSDATTQRLRASSSGWREIKGSDDDQVVEQIRHDEIDILVDLSGHTAWNRLEIIAQKPAPIQMTYLGYPNTTGLPTIDYRLVDSFTDPPGRSDAFSTEKLLRLPHGFLCYQPPTEAPKNRDQTVDESRMIFGSFNNIAKISPACIHLWAMVLHANPGSKLLLKASPLADPDTGNRIKDRFKQQGIEPDRLLLAGALPSLRDHLAFYGNVDIALDTFPYNGTTTTCEALWMGVPVLTLSGSSHRSRVGFSILSSIGQIDWATSTPAEFVETASQLARNHSLRHQLRITLRQKMAASPLMNQQLITGTIEAAYRRCWQHWCASNGQTASREKTVERMPMAEG